MENCIVMKGITVRFRSENSREEQELAQESKRQNLYRRELAWIRRGAKARSTKQKARIQRFEELKGQEGPAAKQSVDIALSGSRLGKST